MPGGLVAGAIFGLTAGTAAYVAVAAVVDVIFSFAIGKLAQLFAPGQSLPPNVQTLTVSGTTQPLTIIYGEVATSGVLVWKGLSGTNNKYLWYIIALAGHQCESITDVWIDSTKVTDASINADTGEVTASAWKGKLYIWRYLGASDDDALATLLSDNAVAPLSVSGSKTFKGLGVTKIAVRCELDQTVFQSGAPQTIRALVKGKRVYDPRLDSTNGGSGLQRLAHPATWTWSANPALCAADYFHGGSVYFDQATPLARLGMGLTTDRVDWSFVANGANTCDESVSIPGSATQARYALGLVLSAGDSHDTNVDKILATMIGQRIWVSGKYRIYAGAYDEPSASIDDDDLTADGYSIQGASSQSDLYNTVVGTYYDPNRDWQQEPCAPRTNDEYVTEDGLPITKNVALDGVTDDYRAQRICNVLANQSRNQIAATLNLKLSGTKVAPWETFNLTLKEEGWTNKVFRAIEINADLGARHIQLTAKEESSDAYDDLAVADYAAPGEAAPTSSIEKPSPPIDLATTSIPGAIMLSWTSSIYFPIGASYEVYEYTADTPLSSATKIASGISATSLVVSKTDTTTRYYWVLARSAQGEASDTEPDGDGVAGVALAGKEVPAFTAPHAITQLNTTVWANLGHPGDSRLVIPGSFAWDCYVPAGGLINVCVALGQTDGDGNYLGYMFRVSATGNAGSHTTEVWRTNGTSFTKIGSSSQTVAAGWHSAVVVVTLPQTFQFYVDGVLQVSIADSTFAQRSGNNFGYSYDYETGGAVAQPGFYKGYVDSSGRAAPNLGAIGPNGSLNTNTINIGISYSSTASSLTFTSGAITLYLMDGTSVTVPALNQTISGLDAATTYYVYPYIDPSNDYEIAFAEVSGQSAFTSPNVAAAVVVQNQQYMALESLTAITAASGGGTGGGAGNHFGCIDAEMWVWIAQRAGDVKAGQTLRAAPDDPEAETCERVIVQHASAARSICYRLRTESGASIVASESTPMTLRDGSSVRFPAMLGREARVLRGAEMRWEPVVSLELVGERKVMRISLGGRVFFGGESPGALVATHNIEKP